MIAEAHKTEIGRCMRAVAEALPGFQKRQGQRVMISAVAQTLGRCPDSSDKASPRPLAGTTIVCANGGTGTGKSIAYAVSGGVLALAKDKKLVISTATVALQEQLVTKDLPFLVRSTGLPLRIALAKGRTRHVCRYRLEDLASTLPSNGTDSTYADMLQALSAASWDGDRDSWAPVSDAVWNPVTTDRHGCLGNVCPQQHQCAQRDARDRVRQANVVVANHDLVLADLAMGGGRLLPSPANSFYVFDEAHHLSEKAVERQATSHPLGRDRAEIARTQELIEQLHPWLVNRQGALLDSLRSNATVLGEALGHAYDFFATLSVLTPTDDTPAPILDFADSYVPEEFESIGATVLQRGTALLEDFRACVDALLLARATSEAGRRRQDRLAIWCSQAIGRLERLLDAWRLFLTVPDPALPPIAKWVQAALRESTLEVSLCASPVIGAEFLERSLWRQAAGVVLTSANLATLGHFDHFLSRAGLDRLDEPVRCVDLPSPFNYPEQGVLRIPALDCNPTNYQSHTAAVCQFVSDALSACQPGEGTLVLFTSRRQMQDVFAALPAPLQANVLVQGDLPKSQLLTRHKAAIGDGRASAIFGLESFAEGVDLAGRACTHVIVTKLPFEVPDTPVLKALTSWIDRRGGHSFLEVFVPLAARKLEQRVGRLIRTETDTGVVTVLDSRLWDKSYGRLMLRGLPPFRLEVRGRLEHA
jgi:ATP-dependent DNA helicase DinG